MTFRPWTVDEDIELLRAKKRGLSIAETDRLLNRSGSHSRIRYLEDRGVWGDEAAIRDMFRRGGWDDELLKKAKRLRRDGHTFAYIAERVGKSASAVERKLMSMRRCNYDFKNQCLNVEKHSATDAVRGCRTVVWADDEVSARRFLRAMQRATERREWEAA